MLTRDFAGVCRDLPKDDW